MTVSKITSVSMAAAKVVNLSDRAHDSPLLNAAGPLLRNEGRKQVCDLAMKPSGLHLPDNVIEIHFHNGVHRGTGVVHFAGTVILLLRKDAERCRGNQLRGTCYEDRPGN